MLPSKRGGRRRGASFACNGRLAVQPDASVIHDLERQLDDEFAALGLTGEWQRHVPLPDALPLLAPFRGLLHEKAQVHGIPAQVELRRLHGHRRHEEHPGLELELLTRGAAAAAVEVAPDEERLLEVGRTLVHARRHGLHGAVARLLLAHGHREAQPIHGRGQALRGHHLHGEEAAHPLHADARQRADRLPSPNALLLPGHGRRCCHRREALALGRPRRADVVVVVVVIVVIGVQVLVELRPRPERRHGQAAGERARRGADNLSAACIVVAGRARERERGGSALVVRLVERVAECVELTEDLVIGLAVVGHGDAPALDLTGSW